jgi:hypothetical protein
MLLLIKINFMADRHIVNAKRFHIDGTSIRFYIQEMSDGYFYGEVQMGFDAAQARWSYKGKLLKGIRIKTQSFPEEKNEKKVYDNIVKWLKSLDLPADKEISET